MKIGETGALNIGKTNIEFFGKAGELPKAAT